MLQCYTNHPVIIRVEGGGEDERWRPSKTVSLPTEVGTQDIEGRGEYRSES